MPRLKWRKSKTIHRFWQFFKPDVCLSQPLFTPEIHLSLTPWDPSLSLNLISTHLYRHLHHLSSTDTCDCKPTGLSSSMVMSLATRLREFPQPKNRVTKTNQNASCRTISYSQCGRHYLISSQMFSCRLISSCHTPAAVTAVLSQLAVSTAVFTAVIPLSQNAGSRRTHFAVLWTPIMIN